MRLVHVPLDMTFADALGDHSEDTPDAYERLIMDVIRGDQTLFMRGDEVEAAWKWTDPIIEAWEARNDVPKLKPGRRAMMCPSFTTSVRLDLKMPWRSSTVMVGAGAR